MLHPHPAVDWPMDQSFHRQRTAISFANAHTLCKLHSPCERLDVVAFGTLSKVLEP